jgi:hypothetical protein
MAAAVFSAVLSSNGSASDSHARVQVNDDKSVFVCLFAYIIMWQKDEIGLMNGILVVHRCMRYRFAFFFSMGARLAE